MHPIHQPSNGKGYIYIYRPGCEGAWHQYAGHWIITFMGNYWVGKSQQLKGVLEHPKHPPGYAPGLIRIVWSKEPCQPLVFPEMQHITLMYIWYYSDVHHFQ